MLSLRNYSLFLKIGILKVNQQRNTMTDFIKALANPALIWILIPIVAIIGSFAVKGLKMHYAHKERMAKIEMGMEVDEEIEE